MLQIVLAQAQDPADRVQDVTKGLEIGIYGLLGVACVGLVVLMIELLPGFIAAMREHPSTLAIFALCFFLGWTGIGWIIALVWSLTTPQPAVSTTVVIRERARRRRDDDDYDD